MAKILERMILGRLTPWVIKRNTLNQNRHGFLPSWDRTTTISQIFNDLGRYHNLYFNPVKSAAINFSNKKTNPVGDLKIDGHPIPCVTRMRVLRLHFSSKLTWKLYISELRVKAFKKLNAYKYISRTMTGISTKILLQIVQATVRQST